MESWKCSLCLIHFTATDGQTSKTKTTYSCLESNNEPVDKGLLNRQLSVIYLVHSVLGIPLDQCSKYLEKYGNPADWVTCCPTCSTTLGNAQDLSRQVKQLQKELDNLHRVIKDQMMIMVKEEPVDGNEESWLTAAYEIRQYVAHPNGTNEVLDAWSQSSVLNESIVSSSFSETHSVSLPFDRSSLMFIDESVPITIKEEDPRFRNASPTFHDGYSDEEWCENGDEHRKPSDSSTAARLIVRKNVKTKIRNPKIRRQQQTIKTKPHEAITKRAQNKKPAKQESKSTKIRKPRLQKIKPDPDSEGTNSQKVKTEGTKGQPPAHPCDQCQVVCRNQLELNKHVNRSHTQGFKCSHPSCGKVVTSIISYERHVRTRHHPVEVITCSGCQVNYPFSRDFVDHLKKNPKCSEIAIPCPECKTKLSTKEALKIHIDVRHISLLQQNNFACTVPGCGKTVTSAAALRRHTERYHSGQSFPCQKCDKVYNTDESVKRHFKNVHLSSEPGAEQFICKTCEMVFRTRRNLVRHEKLHRDEAPYLCPICGKKYKVGNQLTVHMWSHDPDRHQKYSLYKKDRDPSKPKVCRTKRTGNAEVQSPINTSSYTTNTIIEGGSSGFGYLSYPNQQVQLGGFVHNQVTCPIIEERSRSERVEFDNGLNYHDLTATLSHCQLLK